MLDEPILGAADWQRKVKERDEYKCTSCDSDSDITAYFLTPRSLGGRTAVSNGVTLCTKCRMDNSTRAGKDEAEFRKVRYNVPLSKEFQRDLNLLSMAVGRSVADITREVIAEAVFTSKWERLQIQPTNGSPPERTNFWVAKPVFEKFENWCRKKDLTVPTAIRSLLWQWTQEIQKGA